MPREDLRVDPFDSPLALLELPLPQLVTLRRLWKQVREHLGVDLVLPAVPPLEDAVTETGIMLLWLEDHFQAELYVYQEGYYDWSFGDQRNDQSHMGEAPLPPEFLDNLKAAAAQHWARRESPQATASPDR